MQLHSIFTYLFARVAPIPACWLLRHRQQVDLLLTLRVVSESRGLPVC